VIWPASVIKFAKAVSVAEGFGPPENLATRANNPCDLTGADAAGFQTLGVMNSEGVLHFANVADGWTAAYIKFNRMLSGRSLQYPLIWTLEQVGAKFSGGNPEWAINVARELGVPTTTTLEQWVQSNPLE
jgi:hypothetical protein